MVLTSSFEVAGESMKSKSSFLVELGMPHGLTSNMNEEAVLFIPLVNYVNS